MGAVNANVLRRQSHLPGAEAGPSGHDPQAEALDLLRRQAQKVQTAGLVPVAVQEDRPAQVVHRVGDLAEQPPEFCLPGQARVLAEHGPVGLKLLHPHVAPGAQGRYAPGGGKQKEVAAKQLLPGAQAHPGRGPLLGGENLIHLQLVPAAGGLVGVKNANFVDFSPQQDEPRENGAAHVSQADQGHPQAGFRRLLEGLQQLPASGIGGIQNCRAVPGYEIRKRTGRRIRRGDQGQGTFLAHFGQGLHGIQAAAGTGGGGAQKEQGSKGGGNRNGLRRKSGLPGQAVGTVLFIDHG